MIVAKYLSYRWGDSFPSNGVSVCGLYLGGYTTISHSGDMIVESPIFGATRACPSHQNACNSLRAFCMPSDMDRPDDGSSVRFSVGGGTWEGALDFSFVPNS